MSALVPELVDMASSPTVSTADLLRRALVVASRLDVPELVGWIQSELNGYVEDVPEYRTIIGALFVDNPYRGDVPFVIPAEMNEPATRVKLHQSIPELIQLAQRGSMLKRYFPPEAEQALMTLMEAGTGYVARPFVKFTSTQVTGVIERVRSRVLDWALDLERRGIIGDGMSFTMKEKEAVQAQHYHFGDVSGSQIQISSNGSTQTQANTANGTDLEALRGLIDALGVILERDTLRGDTADELRAELETLKAQAASPKPKWEVIKATARSIKSVAEGAAGNILGQLAQPHAATLLALAAGALGA